jgi:hypothetical protein
MGKATEAIGDSLAGFAADLTVEQRTAFLADPAAAAASLLGSATTRTVYDLDRYQRERQPVCAAVLSREIHASGQPPGSAPKVSLSLSYSDGFGRQVQQKIRTEPGPVVDGGPVVSPRWIGSGWTIFTNKGKPVQRFDPVRPPGRRQLDPGLRPPRAGGGDPATRPHLGEGDVRPLAAGDLGRQRHRRHRQAAR